VSTQTSIPALVLGEGVSALGTTRALARSGVETYAVGAAQNFASYSRYYRRHPAAAATDPSEDGLRDFLESLGEGAAVLMPCSDAWLLSVARLPAATRQRFATSLPPAAMVEDFVDKAGFSRLLDTQSVPHPVTRPIESVDDLSDKSFASLGECFLKPRQSQRFASAYGVKAFRARGLGEAQQLWQKAHAEGHEMILQEYIPGPPTHHYFVDGFIDAGGILRAAFARRRVRMHPPEFGNSTSTGSIPFADIATGVQGALGMLPSIGYRGIFSVEFKKDPRDEVFKVLEINARPWWYIGFAAVCGVNMAKMAYDDALGRPVQNVDSYRTGVTCTYLRHDVHAARRMFRAGEISPAAWVWSIARSVWPVFTWSDPRPAFHHPWD
jgi:D-aspartate ligase